MSRNSQRTMRDARRSLWFRTYRQRMTEGLERCRRCGTAKGLTFDHIIAAVHGRKLTFDNATILCRPCNAAKGHGVWGDLVSLAEEEASAPSDRRWCEIATQAAVYEAVRHPWASWELDLLSTSATASEVAMQLGRTVKAVQNQRYRLRHQLDSEVTPVNCSSLPV